MPEPTQDAESTLATFIGLFNAGTDVDAIVGLFAPNVQFWGTVSPEIGNGTDVVHNYFAGAFARRAGATVVATVTERAVQALSDDVVVVAGRWQIERGGNTNRLRFSMTLNRRNGRWAIAQFHSSPRPTPP